MTPPKKADIERLKNAADRMSWKPGDLQFYNPDGTPLEVGKDQPAEPRARKRFVGKRGDGRSKGSRKVGR